MIKVHSYESMGTYDGPGLRLVVFLQGCPFRCLYCANPDTIAFDGGTQTESGQKVGSTPVPSPTLSVLRTEESGFDKKTEEDSIYKQESDIRKAERRVREARKQEPEEETETTEEQAAEGTEETESIKKTEEDKLETEESKKASATETVKDNTTSQAETSTIPDSGRSYIIRPGDTLYQISLENYGSMDAVEKICSMNGISADEIIYPGQIIVLP